MICFSKIERCVISLSGSGKCRCRLPHQRKARLQPFVLWLPLTRELASRYAMTEGENPLPQTTRPKSAQGTISPSVKTCGFATSPIRWRQGLRPIASETRERIFGADHQAEAWERGQSLSSLRMTGKKRILTLSTQSALKNAATFFKALF